MGELLTATTTTTTTTTTATASQTFRIPYRITTTKLMDRCADGMGKHKESQDTNPGCRGHDTVGRLWLRTRLRWDRSAEPYMTSPALLKRSLIWRAREARSKEQGAIVQPTHREIDRERERGRTRAQGGHDKHTRTGSKR